MKKVFLAAAISCVRWVLQFIYFFMKLLPVQNKIVMLSRQSNHLRLDFDMLSREISRRDSTVKQVFLCQRIENGIWAKIKYSAHILRCMHHIATSKVVILDTYSIPVSLLSHRKGLSIIQIWHAPGAIKKFGLQSVGMEEGRDEALSRYMRMHKNYTAVLCASQYSKKIYAEAFGTDQDKILVTGIPRVDYILENGRNKKNAERVYRLYPQLKSKKNILYVPTFRKEGLLDLHKILPYADSEDYNLIIRLHPLDMLEQKNNPLINGYEKCRTIDLLTVADYVITDYSAIAIEAALLDIPIFFYVYDIDLYRTERGLNFDPTKQMPSASSTEIDEIMAKIMSDEYDREALAEFKHTFVEHCDTDNVNRITDYIMSCMEDANDK